MPIYQRDDLKDKLPWVEIDDFEFLSLDHSDPNGGVMEITPSSPREMVVVISGELTAETEAGRVTLKRRDWLEIPKSGVRLTSAKTITTTYACEFARIAGTWNDTNIVAVFQFRPDRPLEMHYHDFNEYWFIFRGHFIAQVDGTEAAFRPGMMLATRTGNEHGILEPPETIEGIGFSTTMVRQKRQGHLHRDEHGDPVPMD